MSYWADAFERNPIHEAERQESRSALHGLTELQRVANCGHSSLNRQGQCQHCGEVPA